MKKGGQQIELSAESKKKGQQIELSAKSKVKVNEMYSNCEYSYRPVIIGFVQCQHSSVELVKNENEKCKWK